MEGRGRVSISTWTEAFQIYERQTRQVLSEEGQRRVQTVARDPYAARGAC